MPNRAVFLDRDGVINKDVDFLTRKEDIAILSGVTEAIELLKDAGFLIIVVTNQSAVARGMLTETELKEINESIKRELEKSGSGWDALYYCPHLEDATIKRYARRCQCRKPKAGLMYRAANDFDLDLSASFMVGDSATDIQAGNTAGCTTVFIYGGSIERASDIDADFIAKDLISAARKILSLEKLQT